MPRPPRFDAELLLDAAVELADDLGPSRVTMAGVARHANAPSGSLYHRFPSRAVLLGELWLRTLNRFQEGYLTQLAIEDPTLAAHGAARHVIEWSRSHPAQAKLLLHPKREYEPKNWPADLTARATHASATLRSALRTLVERLGLDTERVTIAVTDLPYAVVRRHIIAGHPIPAAAAQLVHSCVAALLRPG